VSGKDVTAGIMRRVPCHEKPRMRQRVQAATQSALQGSLFKHQVALLFTALFIVAMYYSDNCRSASLQRQAGEIAI